MQNVNEASATERVASAYIASVAKHPHYCDTLAEGLMIITEEIGEVAEAVQRGDRADIMSELAQVAASAVRMMVEYDELVGAPRPVEVSNGLELFRIEGDTFKIVEEGHTVEVKICPGGLEEATMWLRSLTGGRE